VSGQSIPENSAGRKPVSEEELEKAEELSRNARIPIEQALLEHKCIELEQLGKVFEKRFRFLGRLEKHQVGFQSRADDSARDYAERRVVAFRKRGKILDVAMIDPRDAATVDRLQIITGSSIQPYLVELRALGPVLRKFVPDMSEAQTRIKEDATGDMQSASQEESTVQLVNKIIEGAINARATDIHLDPQDDHLRVRYRIDGMLYDIMTIQDQQMVLVSARVKVLANMNITERRRSQDGHITHAKTDGGKYDLRVSTLPTHLGEKIVLRLLDDTTVLKGMRQLGLEDKDLERVEQLIRRPYGMLLVTGPIGSGKTTMLYAALSEVNQANRNIITIEDPIEYQLPGINQVQVDPNIDMNFADGLRGILRQDADILMVGEIRDAETAQTAVRAAMTGHLLFSTLHTNYAINAITTLRHLGVQPFLIAGSVIGVVAQRLVRRVCPHCSESFVPPLSMRPDLGLAKNSRKTIKRAVGCNECYQTGYIGRTGVYEVFSISPKIKEMIVDGASEEALLKTALGEGMTPLPENGKAKVLSGETTFDELMRVIYM
jgi:type IV pilus assembly protein PilB